MKMMSCVMISGVPKTNIKTVATAPAIKTRLMVGFINLKSVNVA